MGQNGDPQQKPPAVRSGVVPPSVLDSEGAVLSQLVNDIEGVFDRVHPILKPEHMFSDANKRIYEVVCDLRAANAPVDIGTIANELKARGRLAQVGGSTYLGQLVEGQPYFVHVEAHARAIRDAWRARQVIAKCQVSIAEGYSQQFPVENGAPVGSAFQTWVETIERDISELAHVHQDARLTLLGPAAHQTVTALRAAQEAGQKISGTETGYPDLDKMMTGLHGGDLTVLAARPGVGKTGLMVSIARNVARPRDADDIPDGVAIFSLEMPLEQISLRFASGESGVDYNAIRELKLNRDQWQNLVDSTQTLSTMPIWIDPSPTLTVLECRSQVRRLQREIASGRMPVRCKKLVAVFIDYLQLMQGIRLPGANREQEIASLSRGLKAMAKDLDVHVMALAQLNRAPENRGKDHRPVISDIRESGAAEADADNIWLLYRPGYYDQNKSKSETELIVGKQRNGPTGIVHLYFDGARTSFKSAERSSDSDDYAEIAGEFDNGFDRPM